VLDTFTGTAIRSEHEEPLGLRLEIIVFTSLANTIATAAAATMRHAVVCPGIEAKRGGQPDHTEAGEASR